VTFEERVDRMEEIVHILQTEELPLERALALFEEGVAHLREAAVALSQAEQSVRVLRESADGSFDTPELRG
jgi:exodeoxyribonuclease VII small subunit